MFFLFFSVLLEEIITDMFVEMVLYLKSVSVLIIHIGYSNIY